MFQTHHHHHLLTVLNKKEKLAKAGSLQTALLLRKSGALYKQVFLQPGFCIREAGKMYLSGSIICSLYIKFASKKKAWNNKKECKGGCRKLF